MRRRLGLLLGLVALAAAGCSTSEQGQPRPGGGTSTTAESTTDASSPAPSPSGPASSDLPSDGAPKVEDPVEADRFAQDPCAVFTQAQATELGVGHPGKPRDSPLGTACTWRNDGGGVIEFLWADKDPRGLSGPYKANKAGKYAYFEVLPDVAGLPAVAYDVVDTRAGGRCAVSVGLSDELMFSIVLTQSHSKVGSVEPCAVAADVAGKAVRTIKGGN